MSAYASGKNAIAFCDRCAFEYPYMIKNVQDLEYAQNA